jgi:hypothetical protein
MDLTENSNNSLPIVTVEGASPISSGLRGTPEKPEASGTVNKKPQKTAVFKKVK